MNKPIDFDHIQRKQALESWSADCKRRVALRFPLIDFDADDWPMKTLHRATQGDYYFHDPLADFEGKDISYREVLRCLVAEAFLAGKPKDVRNWIWAFRLLAHGESPHRIFDITHQCLRKIESDWVIQGKSKQSAASTIQGRLSRLAKLVSDMSAKGVLPRLGFHLRKDTTAELRKTIVANADRLREGKHDILDRKMEAFNDAFNVMLDNPLLDGKPALNAGDRVAICLTAILLCAPSRINEVLCMSVDDYVTVDDYAKARISDTDTLHRAHQLLLVTMKGSKGAEWSPKPVLEFMIDVFHYCLNIIKTHGKRSRMLVQWYEEHPDELYLPPELEYLRGEALSRSDLTKIVNFGDPGPKHGYAQTAERVFSELKDKAFLATNRVTQSKNGRKTPRPMIAFLHWPDVEKNLLEKVHRAMANCRRVTEINHYMGDLSKMLFLFDSDGTPFLPTAINYQFVNKRLKRTESRKESSGAASLFERLGIAMPVNGKIQFAMLDTHDPRRWLTTMALIHGEKLSDVLVNKWARRCNLTQLKAYDFRTAEIKAAATAMPDAAQLTELSDLSYGLAAIEKLEEVFGLESAIVAAHDAGIAMTSMDAVTKAVENRPVAKSSRGIIIIYPQRFGVCFHQHHEKPCRNYSNDLTASCVTCNEGSFVKGHIPTNDETRKVAVQLFGSILRHLENLAITHNRSIADDPAALGEHMLTLIEKGLDRGTMVQLATHLIDNFHEVNRLLKDRLLANRLHQAFVAREVVRKLDDQDVAGGALIKYHNPTQHADLLLEIALDARGGREQVARDEQALIAKHPQFAPRARGLKDERHLIAPDNDSDED